MTNGDWLIALQPRVSKTIPGGRGRKTSQTKSRAPITGIENDTQQYSVAMQKVRGGAATQPSYRKRYPTIKGDGDKKSVEAESVEAESVEKFASASISGVAIVTSSRMSE